MSVSSRNALYATLVLAYVICTSSCGGGSSTTSSSTTNPPPPNALAVTALATTSSNPLAPLVIKTSGGNTDPVTVNFSNSAGFSVTSSAISVTSGSVTVPVPLYIDPNSKTTASGGVSIVLTQDGKSTAPTNFTIEDLPPQSTYGTQVGQITHAFVIFEQILLGENLDEMQTLNIAMASNSKVAGETGNAAHTLYSSLIPGVNNARNDIDQVMLNNSMVFPWGTLSNGTQIQFDAKQLDFMDRIAALYLVQQFSTTPTVARMRMRTNARHGKRASSKSTTQNTFQTILSAITSGNAVYELTEDLRNSPTSSASTGLAFVDGLQMTAASQGAEQFSSYVGMVSGLAHFTEAVNTQLNLILPTAACLASPGCNSSTYIDQLASDETNAGVNAAAAVAAAMSNIPGILDLQSNAATVVDELLNSVVNIYNLAHSGTLQNISSAALDAVSSSSFGTVANKLGVMNSNVAITNNLGVAASLTGVQLQQCPPTSCTTSFNVTNVADTGGSYQLVIPLDISGASYGTMDVVAFDFATNTGLATETVDLTGLNPNSTVQVPPMSGVCNDTDYGAPDGDDPDCD
jgi:hypothetical protein